MGYRLGANVPTSLTTQINSYTQNEDFPRWSPTLVTFAPSGEWMLVGAYYGDEGQGTLDYSEAFPKEVQNWISTLPLWESGHTSVLHFEFDPSGGWILIDTSNNVYYSQTGIDPALKKQVTTLQGAGQTVVDCACLALNGPILPMPAVQQPSPVETNFGDRNQFETIWNPPFVSKTSGFLMKTVINEIDSGGNIFADTALMSATWSSGFHGSVFLTFFDFTGNVIWQLSSAAPEGMVVAETFGIDNVFGMNQNNPETNPWSASIGTAYLQIVRSVAITHIYTPESLEQIIQSWLNAISNTIAPVATIAKSIGTIGGLGGGG